MLFLLKGSAPARRKATAQPSPVQVAPLCLPAAPSPLTGVVRGTLALLLRTCAASEPADSYLALSCSADTARAVRSVPTHSNHTPDLMRYRVIAGCGSGSKASHGPGTHRLPSRPRPTKRAATLSARASPRLTPTCASPHPHPSLPRPPGSSRPGGCWSRAAVWWRRRGRAAQRARQETPLWTPRGSGWPCC